MPVVPGRHDTKGRASKLAIERHEQMNCKQSARSSFRWARTGLAVCAATVLCLIPLNDNDQGMLAGFGIVLSLLSGTMYLLSRRMRPSGCETIEAE